MTLYTFELVKLFNHYNLSGINLYYDQKHENGLNMLRNMTLDHADYITLLLTSAFLNSK